jgi:hypothetical protein
VAELGSSETSSVEFFGQVRGRNQVGGLGGRLALGASLKDAHSRGAISIQALESGEGPIPVAGGIASVERGRVESLSIEGVVWMERPSPGARNLQMGGVFGQLSESWVEQVQSSAKVYGSGLMGGVVGGVDTHSKVIGVRLSENPQGGFSMVCLGDPEKSHSGYLSAVESSENERSIFFDVNRTGFTQSCTHFGQVDENSVKELASRSPSFSR